MLISFLRSILLYLMLILVIRLMGKRQLGEMEPSEFVVSILIADLASVPMQDEGIPLLAGVVPILTVLALELMLSALSVRSVRVRRILCGNPVFLIDRGVISERNLRRTRITVDELLEMLRQKGGTDPASVWQAVLETNGQLSVVLRAGCEPASAAETGLSVPQKQIPLLLISDGQVLRRNLAAAGHDDRWLRSQLRARGLRVRDVFLLTEDPEGRQNWLPRESRA